jgi:hypothetical protein
MMQVLATMAGARSLWAVFDALQNTQYDDEELSRQARPGQASDWPSLNEASWLVASHITVISSARISVSSPCATCVQD